MTTPTAGTAHPEEFIVMPYERTASRHHPAHVLMLIDISESMKAPCNGRQRIDLAMDAAEAALDGMIDLARDSHGQDDIILPRFQVGLYGYHQWVQPLHPQKQPFVSISELQDLQPWADPQGQTNGVTAFEYVHELLRQTLPQMEGCPAPLIIHLTDAEFTEQLGSLSRMEELIASIKRLRVEDGSPLIEHVYIGDAPLTDPIGSLSTWPGITREAQLRSAFARFLFHTASPTPPAYRRQLIAKGVTSFQEQARLLFPGDTPALVRAAFTLSGTTGLLR